MTTEPKAEGGEAVGWVFQHDENGRMTFCPNDGVNTPEVFAELNPGYTLCSAAYTHPTPAAVEALARAAKEARSGYAWHAGLRPGGTDRLDSEALARIDTALAHPEIAALLKETK